MRHATQRLLLVAGALLCGAPSCSDTVSYEIPAPPPGAAGKTDKAVFDDSGRLIDPRGDSDGDGIPDKEEVDGWVITVDNDGYAVLAATTESFKEELELRSVTSDPRYADTDGDGLDDKAERAAACDPRRADTDGDTLSDRDELERWYTSPSSVDTDGDARGGDPDDPRPPLYQLFDAAELRLEPSPTDPSVVVPGRGATSPYLNDSDADGRNDYVETLGGVMSPIIAEVPKLALVPTPNAEMHLGFITKRTDVTGAVEERALTTELAESGYVTAGSSVRLSLVHTQYAGAYVDFSAHAGCCLDIASGDIEAGIIVKSEDRFEQEIRFDLEVGGAFEANRIEREMNEAYEREEITIEGAEVRVPMDVVNTGTVPFRLEDLVLVLTRFDRYARTYTPVVELAGEDMTLAPGERRTLSLVSTDVPIEALRALMRDPQSISFSASRFALRDADGRDFDFQMGDVLQQTAIVDVDLGDRSSRYFVAANADPTRGITIGRALEEAGVPFSAQPLDVDGAPGAEAYAIAIAGLGTEFHTGPASDLDDRLPYRETGGPGPRLIKRGWFGAVVRRDALEGVQFYANLFDAPVFPGDRVTLIYTEDQDRDGVSAFEEAMHGSSDELAHSDGTGARPEGDGLSDFWEIHEGWTVETAGRAPYRVYPSPAALDSDFDGLDDDEEAAGAVTDFGTGTDPWTADTDEDGLSDVYEAADPLGYGLSPLDAGDDRPAPAIACVVTPTYPAGTWTHAPTCFVAVVPDDILWGDVVGRPVPCADFVKVGSGFGARYEVVLEHPDPPDPEQPENFRYTAAVPAVFFEAAPGTRIDRTSTLPTEPERHGYIEPAGRSEVCNILVPTTPDSSHGWVRVPCRTLVDETGNGGKDGVCELVRPCGGGIGACPEGYDADPAWRGEEYVIQCVDHPPLPPQCQYAPQGIPCGPEVLPALAEPDLSFDLEVVVTDAQDDLVTTDLFFDEVGGFMRYTNEPVDPESTTPPPPVDYAVSKRFKGCVDPTKIRVEATDSVGSRGEATCAWAPAPADASERCRPITCGETELQACVPAPIRVP